MTHNADDVAAPRPIGRVDHFGEIHLDAGLERAGWLVLVISSADWLALHSDGKVFG